MPRMYEPSYLDAGYLSAGQFCSCRTCKPPRQMLSGVTHQRSEYNGTTAWKFGGAGPMFYGMELEVWPNSYRQPWLTACDYLGDALAQVKPDGGLMEMASHPMDLPHFMVHYPWDMLPKLAADGCSADPGSAGIHIHASKAGFGGEDHIYRWFMFHYGHATNRLALWKLGGRPGHRDHFNGAPSQAGMRSLARRVALGEEVKRLRHQVITQAELRAGVLYLREADKPALQNLIAAHRASSSSGGQGAAIAVLRHDDTFEIRFPGSSLRPEQARAMVQLASAGVEFTREDNGTEFGPFREWAAGRGEYPDLNLIMKEKL